MEDHQALENLMGFNRELAELTERVLQTLKTPHVADSFGLMCFCFLCMQLHYLESLSCLKNKWATILIARTMMEGMGHLMWVNEDKEGRGNLWRDFAPVRDLRLLESKPKNDHVDSSNREAIESLIEIYGQKFLKKKHGQAGQSESWNGKDFRWDWRGETVKQIFDDIGHEQHHQTIYRNGSELCHWDPGILRAFTRKGDALSFSLPDAEDEKSSFMVAFESVFKTLRVTNSHFELGLSDILNDMGRRVAALGPKTDDPSSESAVSQHPKN